jgi:type VI secretion system secreted protein VgrG
MARVMEITTPLGADLLFHGMHAHEELGRLAEYQIDLLSPKNDLDPDKMLGKNVTVKLALPDDSTRFFNGFVTRFSQGGSYGRYIRYFATVRSWLWFLTRTTDCRIFQEMTVPDIVKKVFGDHSTADFKFELTGSYRKWVYCVQYRETDYNFISRLLEEEGIYYYIRHTDGHNTVVLTDSTSKHTATPGYEKIPFVAPEQLVRPELEHIGTWDFSREIQPGVYVHDDYDLERPSVELKTRKALTRSYSPSDYEVYDYPGHYIQKGDGEQYAGVRIDELGTLFEVSRATSNSKGIHVGSLFTLEKYPREDQNVEHLIVSAAWDLEFGDYEAMPPGAETSYRCSFAAMSSKQQFRPMRITPKPFVQGPQTALVVGPGGEEIYTDKYGRVKVQFHWDRYGKKDENSSCWIRVSHPWAGKNWGAIATPRMGQEVVVDFLEGDPDQPLITGRVYNAEQMPPYGLPGNKTQTGIKSRSSLGGSPENFNEIRFEDKKGSEQLFIHAEKNQDIEVENDETHSVGHDRTKTIGHDETTLVKHDRTETVDNNETITVHGQRTETVDLNETITIHGNRTISVDQNESATVTLMRTHTVGINEAITVGAAQEITVGAIQAVTVGANQTITVGNDQATSVGSNQTTSVAGGRSITVAGDQSTTVSGNVAMSISGDETRSVKGNRVSTLDKDDATKVTKNWVLDAGDSIVLKTGSASIEMKKDGTIQIKGKDIAIMGSGKIDVKADGDVVIKGSKISQN